MFVAVRTEYYSNNQYYYNYTIIVCTFGCVVGATYIIVAHTAHTGWLENGNLNVVLHVFGLIQKHATKQSLKVAIKWVEIAAFHKEFIALGKQQIRVGPLLFDIQFNTKFKFPGTPFGLQPTLSIRESRH